MNKIIEQEIAGLEGPIVVFGAGGFIGANLVLRILRQRPDVFAVTHQRYCPWRLQNLPPSRLITCDVSDLSVLSQLFTDYAFRTIFVLSAYGAYSRQKVASQIHETNFIGLVNIVEAAQIHGFSALVHAGSSSEYGTNCSAPAENDPAFPNSHYAVSKLAAAHLVEYLGKHEKLPVNHLRYYSVYGPFEESDRLIPRLVEKAMEGTYPPLVDPEISRDFVFIDDAVEATLLSATRGVRNSPGAVLNIASGKKTTLKELVDLVRRQFSISAAPNWGSMENRNWDLRNWFGNPDLAQSVLGWRSSTSLEQGIAETAQWLREKGRPPTVEGKIDDSKPIRLSAVIACYKDAQAIPLMHRRLTATFKKIGVDYEIIFVNDGSPDNSSEVLTTLCASDSQVVALEHSRNFGSQSAFLSGMSIATGHAVILLDGDLQDPPELIENFYQKWREGNEVVYGRRVKRETGLILGLCYRAFYRLLRYISEVKIPVDAGDFSLIDRKIVDQILELPETDQFLRGLRAWVGFRQTGVDYVRPERAFGRSTNNWFKNLWWARKAIFSFSFVPLEMLLYSGIALTSLAVAIMIWQVIYRLQHPEMPHGTATIVILVLFFGGANVLAASILGEYLGKVLEETKKRPRFIRRRITVGRLQMESKEAIDSFVSARHNTSIRPSIRDAA